MNSAQQPVIHVFPSTIFQTAADADWCNTETPAQFLYEREGKPRRVVVGRCVREQDLPGAKIMNLSARDAQYEDLLISAMLHSVPESETEINVVCGFPRCTLAAQMSHLSAFKGRTFNITTPSGTREITIREVWPLPEALGHAYGVRKALDLDSKLFSMSIGFGTVEIVVLSADGRPLNSSLISEPLGVRHAALMFKELIQKEGHHVLPSNGGSDAWWDNLLWNSYNENSDLRVIVDGEPLPIRTLKHLADCALSTYVDTILVERIEQIMNDHTTERMDFSLTGGGALYVPVRKTLEALATRRGLGVLPVTSEQALLSAVNGYVLAAHTSEHFMSRTMAVDIGNSNTVVAFLD